MIKLPVCPYDVYIAALMALPCQYQHKDFANYPTEKMNRKRVVLLLDLNRFLSIAFAIGVFYLIFYCDI